MPTPLLRLNRLSRLDSCAEADDIVCYICQDPCRWSVFLAPDQSGWRCVDCHDGRRGRLTVAET